MKNMKEKTKMKYKLLAIDIDDTLVPRHCPVSERNVKAIKKAEEAGIYVSLATGRGFYGSSHVWKPLGLSNYVINYGGAVIMDPKTDRPVFETELDDKYIHDILDMAKEFGVHAHIYQGDCVIYERTDKYAEAYVKALNLPHKIDPQIHEKHWKNVPKALIITEPERVEGLINAFQAHFKGEVYVSASSKGFIEFNKVGANKGTALKWLADHFGIKQEETAAIGDNTLDYEMIAWAGLGAVVANGNEKVKAAADIMVPECKDDGVAWFIENCLLNK